MKLKLIGTMTIIAALGLSGCQSSGSGTAAPANGAPAAQAQAAVQQHTAPTAHVQSLIDKYQLEDTTFEYVKERLGNVTPAGTLATLIDARPERVYNRSTIPTAINIPDTNIDGFIHQLADTPKDRELIVFCGGWACEKSPIVAGHLKGMGFTNVKLYQAGTPEWFDRAYPEVGFDFVKAAFNQPDKYLMMDSRPHRLFMRGTIPGSLWMNDEDMPKLEGRFPIDKDTHIITFCQGYICHKTHVVAFALRERGYTNVYGYSAGYPEWNERGMPTTAGGGQAAATPAEPREAVYHEGVKLGVDDGTVDGEWLKAHILAGTVPDNVLIVDTGTPEEFATGHVKGAVNASTSTPEKIVEVVTGTDKIVIFLCPTGARASDAWVSITTNNVAPKERVYFFDANVICDKEGNCQISVHEPLG